MSEIVVEVKGNRFIQIQKEFNWCQNNMTLQDWCKERMRKICYALIIHYVIMVHSYNCVIAFLFHTTSHRRPVPSPVTTNFKRNWKNAFFITKRRRQIVSIHLFHDNHEGSMEFNHSKADDTMDFDTTEILKQEEEEELFDSLTTKNEEVYQKRKTKYFSEQVRHSLELHWSIQKANEDCDLEDITSCSEPCPSCRGTGLVICRFCDGVGYLDMGPQLPGTIGKALLKDRMGVECPVCNDDAEQVCEMCMGSGWIANWRKTVSGINQMNSTNYNSFTP